MKSSLVNRIVAASGGFLAAVIPLQNRAETLLDEDFAADSGGLVAIESGASAIPAFHDPLAGTWFTPGDESGFSTNFLELPALLVPSTGALRLTFDHRFRTEADWEGITVETSINGGDWTRVPARAFTRNRYNSHIIAGFLAPLPEGFSHGSPGQHRGEFITSVAELGAFPAGDTIRIRFAADWAQPYPFNLGRDQFLYPPGVYWELDRVRVERLEDGDGDGMSDAYEVRQGLDPNADDAASDLDGDGLTNLEEFLRGSEARHADSDEDGLPDASEPAVEALRPDLQASAPNVIARYDFEEDGEGFQSEAYGTTPVPPVHVPASGSWTFPADAEGPSTTILTSPVIQVPATGAARLHLRHRHDFEEHWDGAVVEVSIDGGPFRRVPASDFALNGYTVGVIIGGLGELSDQACFSGRSEGWQGGGFTRSVAELGPVAAGGTLQVRFLAVWDTYTAAESPNWEIDSVAIQLWRDGDGDGMPDHFEEAHGLDAAAADGASDLDGDGLANRDEFLQGTNPADPDTDGDGLRDLDERDGGTDARFADTDGDGIDDLRERSRTRTDPNLVDTDGDGFGDGEEVAEGSDALDGESVPPLVPDLEWTARRLSEGGLRRWYPNANRINDRAIFWSLYSHGFVQTGTSNLRAVRSWVSAPYYRFRFDAAGVSAGQNDSWQDAFGDPLTKQDASWEMVFRPGDYTGDRVLFETGGNQDGVALLLLGSVLEFRCQDADAPENRISLSADLAAIGPPSDFHHVVATCDVTTASSGTCRLYVNGTLVAGPVTSTGELNDWSGGNEAWLGTGESLPGTAEFGRPRFTGDIASLGFYADRLLDAGEVRARYRRLGPRDAPLQLAISAEGDALTLRWEGLPGMSYHLRSATDPSVGDPATWPIHGGSMDLPGVPGGNSLTIPLPPDARRFFVLEEVDGF